MFVSSKKFNALVTKVNNIEETILSENSTVITKEILNEQKKKEVAYALNLCTVSVSQIVDYNDIYILEQEYDTILNNLNLQNFVKEEAFLKVLKQILDTITFFRIQEGDKKFIEKEYQHKMKNAIWSAVPNFGAIFAFKADPITVAITAATQVGTGYMNYRKNKSQYIIDKEKQYWELQRSAIDQFNGLRRDLFETAWRLSEIHNFNDEDRLTEKQINHYNLILIDSDPLRRFEKLDVISDVFKAFAPFWYYKGAAAREIYRGKNDGYDEIRYSYKEKALESFRNFDSNYIEFMREDVLAASCALEHISLLNINNDRDEIIRLLKNAIRRAGDNLDILQMCVFIYFSLDMYYEATNTLRKLVNEEYNIELNGLLLSRCYCKEKNETEYKILEKRVGLNNIMPWIEDDDKANFEYINRRVESVKWRFGLFLDTYVKKEYNKLFFCMGFLNRNMLHNKPKDNIADIITNFEYTDFNLLFKDSLNNLFSELNNLPICCSLDEREKLLRKIALEYGDELENLRRKEDEVRNFIKTGDGGRIRKHEHRKEHPDNQEMYTKIYNLIYETKYIFIRLTKYIKEEFKNSFTVQIATSAEAIIHGIDLWYAKNEESIPISENSQGTSLYSQSMPFF